MKYVIVVPDGMADYPLEELGNKTPMQVADKRYMNMLAPFSVVGSVQTVPNGMAAGSDIANMSLMGYDPEKYYSGRSPFEAVSIGIDFSKDDITFRCNFVTLSEDEKYEEKTIIDHSADEITTEEADELMKDVRIHFSDENKSFYTGISYRHILLWKNIDGNFNLTPPHDILNKCINNYLPKGDYCNVFLEMMRESYNFLNEHPINKKRESQGKRKANSIWLWGEGKKPILTDFFSKYGMHAAVISAVDLIKGIAKCAEMDSIDVAGATGNIDTNYSGKANSALNELINKGKDLVYIHVEAPDECGHRAELDNKIKSIEYIDNQIIGPIYETLTERKEAFKLLIVPDHPTPISLRTHVGESVPFMVYNSIDKKNNSLLYEEDSIKNASVKILKGHELMEYFINNELKG